MFPAETTLPPPLPAGVREKEAKGPVLRTKCKARCLQRAFASQTPVAECLSAQGQLHDDDVLFVNTLENDLK